MDKSPRNFSEMLSTFIHKFAGNKKDVKLNFHELTVEFDAMGLELNGFVVIDLALLLEKRADSDLKMSNWLANAFKLGEIAVSIDHQEDLKLKVQSKKIDLNIIDKQFLKKVLSGLGDGGTSLLSSVGQLRSIAEGLRDQGLSLVVSYKNERVATLGSDAKPRFSNLVTGTDAIEINSLLRLIELGV